MHKFFHSFFICTVHKAVPKVLLSIVFFTEIERYVLTWPKTYKILHK